MADDWNTVTIIGSRRNQAGGGGNKERQLNIARRQGAAITTETKVPVPMQFLGETLGRYRTY